MRILNSNNQEITNPDLTLGHLQEEEIFIAHHKAVAAVEEVGHFEVIAEYPNGGKDVEWIIDIPGVTAQDAWDEYEAIWRYIPYTEEELAAKAEEENREKTLQARIAELEEQLAFTKILLGVE